MECEIGAKSARLEHAWSLWTMDDSTYDASIANYPQALEEPHAYVAVVAGSDPQSAKLYPGADVSIGRSHSCAIQVEDGAVSRLQATLQWNDDHILLTDHGSRNGTFVDGQRIEGSVKLTSGSEIKVGKAQLVVVIRSPRGATPAAGPRAAVNDAELIAHDPTMLRALALAERAARSDSTVLIMGETGVGKEVLARRIHQASSRSEQPLIVVNCGTIPENLAESVLFGHQRGSFTGADADHVGFFEAANGGTLVLDEVGELSTATQSRLLRALQDRTIMRVGGTDTISVDLRMIASTNCDLDAMVKEGTFRQDLLYRLDVIRIDVPPLRERPDDILPLAMRFLRQHSPEGALSPDAQAKLRGHAWPGNVRELGNVIERAVTLTDEPLLRATDFPLEFRPSQPAVGLTGQIGELERDTIARALEACGGNQTKAAERLGISRRSLIYRMEKFGLKRSPGGQGPREGK